VGRLAAAARQVVEIKYTCISITLTPTPIVWLGFGAPFGGRRERTEGNKEKEEGRRSRSRSMRRLRRLTEADGD